MCVCPVPSPFTDWASSHTQMHKNRHTPTHTCTHSPVALLCATSSCYHGDDGLVVHHHDGVVAQWKVKGLGWHGVLCICVCQCVDSPKGEKKSYNVGTFCGQWTQTKQFASAHMPELQSEVVFRSFWYIKLNRAEHIIWSGCSTEILTCYTFKRRKRKLIIALLLGLLSNLKIPMFSHGDCMTRVIFIFETHAEQYNFSPPSSSSSSSSLSSSFYHIIVLLASCESVGSWITC